MDRKARMAKLITDRFGGNQAEFARAIKRQPTVVYQYLSDRRKIGEDFARHIERSLRLPTLWMDQDDDTPSPTGGRLVGQKYSAPGVGAELLVSVPVVGAAQLGDDGYWAELGHPVGYGDGYIPFPTRDPNAYALRCRGDSMKPRIKDGEYVIVEPNREAIPGDEVLVKAKDGRVMVKELLYVRDGAVHLLSVNEAHGKLALPLDQVEAMHTIVAVVKAVLHEAGPGPQATKTP